MGHEFIGDIVETGKDVKLFKPGDKVVSAFTTSWYVSELDFDCGRCFLLRIVLRYWPLLYHVTIAKMARI